MGNAQTKEYIDSSSPCNECMASIKDDGDSIEDKGKDVKKGNSGSLKSKLT